MQQTKKNSHVKISELQDSLRPWLMIFINEKTYLSLSEALIFQLQSLLRLLILHFLNSTGSKHHQKIQSPKKTKKIVEMKKLQFVSAGP